MKYRGKNHTVDSNKREDFIRLRGWDIRCVEKGLDEAEVRSIITELISQRNEVANKMGHVSLLHEQAKKTVIEADEIANVLKTEAVRNAEAEKTTAMARIGESTQQIQAEYEKVPIALKEIVDAISRELTSLKAEFSKEVGTVWTDCEDRLNALTTNQNSNTAAQDTDPSIRYRPRK